MEWKIDTSMVGEVAVTNLRKTLEASRDHWIKTQAEAAHRHVLAAAVDNLDAKVVASKMSELTPAAEAAKAAHLKKSAELAEHMSHGIDAACALAEMFGGVVTASIVGHDDMRHRSGCAKRMSISVDKTWDESWK